MAMLQKGATVEDFELADQSGTTRRLSELLAEGPVVLFFYPKAMTTGCTKESCHFRDLNSDFAAVSAQAVGISADSVERQQKFDSKHGLAMPLLSDPDKVVARIFGVKRPGPLMNKRATFVIDQDRSVVAAFSSEMNMEAHADSALEALRNI